MLKATTDSAMTTDCPTFFGKNLQYSKPELVRLQPPHLETIDAGENVDGVRAKDGEHPHVDVVLLRGDL